VGAMRAMPHAARCAATSWYMKTTDAVASVALSLSTSATVRLCRPFTQKIGIAVLPATGHTGERFLPRASRAARPSHLGASTIRYEAARRCPRQCALTSRDRFTHLSRESRCTQAVGRSLDHPSRQRWRARPTLSERVDALKSAACMPPCGLRGELTWSVQAGR
jgi:hypothetical protein